jgi:hypothetical protein
MSRKSSAKIARRLSALPLLDNRQEAARMGTQKKEKNRKEREGKTGDGMGNVKVKGENFYRYAVCATGAGRMLMAMQNWKEGQGPQTPDRRQSPAQRQGRHHQSRLVSVARSTRCPR